MKIKIASILDEAEKLDGECQVRYIDYDADEWTVPVRINQKRIADMIDDLSIKEIRIILKP